ncbi:hypothetical protein PENTCL1PPCAC_8243 [Pristionchus entomophagus]|uniref:TFIIS N-terminal domain-containing protein n=1 Tax=Pristionchus entomophagus TaxID=358040 RepID=A0AAV5SZP2_9BILA|nr:hypothetical protein PENTCL1PPCAC_8243 [Pristionchus entomophagus]
MVACAVAASASVHSSSSVVGGGGERRAPVASPEVNRSGLGPKAAATMATAASAGQVEQLKQQLQTAIENKDSEKATLAIEELERVNLSREILESTRVGLYVNHARKEMGEMWPPLSKKCRGLIKAWQKLVEPTTNSSSASTSRNGTPSLVSPAVGGGRRLTPHTPANKRITPGVASERASNLSPGANGSYAPKTGSHLLSPGLPMHKSHSVGFDLKDENGERRNGKRKQDEPVPGTIPSSIKRAKTTASGLSGVLTSPAPPSTPSLIETRRAAVQSTSDLVAQLTSNLPQHLGFEDAAKAHEEKMKREMEDQQLAAALANGGEAPQSPYVFDKKRKYERKKPLAGTPSMPASASASSSSTTTVRIVTPPPDEERKGGLVLKLSLSRTTTDMASLAQQAATPASGTDKKEEKERRKREKREAALHASKSAPALALMDEASTSSPAPDKQAAGPSTSAATASWLQQQQSASSSSAASSIDGRDGKKKEKVRRVLANIDWFAMVPSIEELQKRVEKDNERRKVLAGMTDAEKAYTLHVGGRVVLALPYIEIEDRPDFLKFNYPDPGRFYAEENFIGGLMERPVHPPAPPPPTPAAAVPATAAAAGQK